MSTMPCSRKNLRLRYARADLKAGGAVFGRGTGRAELRPMRADLSFERANLRPKRADLSFERANLSLGLNGLI